MSPLTDDLLEVSNDLHFFVMHDLEWNEMQIEAKVSQNKGEVMKEDEENAKKENYGFLEVKILEGNVGYVDFRTFHDPAYANKTAASVMQFLSHTDAVILDLRNNNGGALEMAQFLNSYFFKYDAHPFFKYYYYEKHNQKINREMWQLPAVPGDRLDQQRLYILTSASTFSAAEWMSYSLKNLGRAKIIGEKTAGGAHPIDRMLLPNGFSVNLPFGQVTDLTTNTDFEGKGVIPDIAIASKDALHKAHLIALRELAADSSLDASINYEWVLPVVNNRLNPVTVEAKRLKRSEGKYGKSEIKLVDEGLYYIWNNQFRFILTPLNQDLFVVEGIDDFRIKLVEEKGKIKAIKRVYSDGFERIYHKDA